MHPPRHCASTKTAAARRWVASRSRRLVAAWTNWLVGISGRARGGRPDRAVRPQAAALWPPEVYRERNLVERFFGTLGHFRRTTTRCDKLTRNYLAALHFASARRRVRNSASTV